MVITRSQTRRMPKNHVIEKSTRNLKRKRNTNTNHNVNKRKRRLNNNHVAKKSRSRMDVESIEIGDTIDLSDLLFTNKRNYLTNYNQNKRVKAKDLSGKVIVLLFMSLGKSFDTWRTVRTNLLDMHSKLHPRGGFQVVFVAVLDYNYPEYFNCIGTTPRKLFLERVSTMPWPAIPFSDVESRRGLERIFGISCQVQQNPHSFIIDPRGVVLQCQATPLFLRYGAAGYPFTSERIEFLDSEDNEVQMQPPSVEKLLTSSERDYLINNKGDQVPLHNLDDKVVGLFFCPRLNYQAFTEELKMFYEELSKNIKDFEIVLIYAHGWFENAYNDRIDEHSFMEAFETMPWLALPFKDTNCSKKLQRIFQYPQELLGKKPDARLVIIGPHGKFIEPLGANILLCYGVPAYPFTTFSAANLELERVKKVKVEMFWDQDAVFTQKNGSQVLFSQLVGKRIIVLCQRYLSRIDGMLMELKARYIKMKGTDDEFEVIHIRNVGLPDEYAQAIPWLMHHPFNEDSYARKFIDLVFYRQYTGLLAFDRDGSVVRKSTHPVLGDNMVFPFFHDGDLENEVLLEVKENIDFKI